MADIPLYQPLTRDNTLAAWEPPVVDEGVPRDNTVLVPTSSSDDLSLSTLLGVGKPINLSWSTLAQEAREKQQQQQQIDPEIPTHAYLFEFGPPSEELDPLELDLESLSASESSDALGHASPVTWDGRVYDQHGLYNAIPFDALSSTSGGNGSDNNTTVTSTVVEEQERCVHLSDLVSAGPNDVMPNRLHPTDPGYTSSTLKRKHQHSTHSTAPKTQRHRRSTSTSSVGSDGSEYQASNARSLSSDDEEDEGDDDDDQYHHNVSSNHSPKRSPRHPKRLHTSPSKSKNGTNAHHRPRITASDLPRHPLGIPIPVPNLTKKSRGRKVPAANDVISAEGEGAHIKGESNKRDERTYTCQVPGCGKCFVRGEHLKRHVRSIHTHEKPHTCPFDGCDKAFSRRDNLAQHLKVHQ